MSTDDKKEVVKELAKATSWRHKVTWAFTFLGWAGTMWAVNELKDIYKEVHAMNYAAAKFPIHEAEDSVKYTVLAAKVDCLIVHQHSDELLIASIKHR